MGILWFGICVAATKLLQMLMAFLAFVVCASYEEVGSKKNGHELMKLKASS